MKFNIGDRVICRGVLDKVFGETVLKGKTGIVRGFGTGDNVGVEFDDYIDGHDLRHLISCRNAICREGHGWFVSAKRLQLIVSQPIDVAAFQISFDDVMGGEMQ